ncbi:zinc-binding dehydrogenase [Paenibacillus sp. CF384]|uniref:zinc-dependent alcohol dehydrogenase n=1 Tax=Paenibacillus sp. CF384 TaxID=1884382 RepID=UPI000899AE4B|nr:alcohol dehydrogenase catalytic domain-containing protein [Paenibacillus sp. CF384]SDW05624.1 L-iditol 2-dehydrogenase [Paenibacillus sp. CF384]
MRTKAWYAKAPFQFELREGELTEIGENEVLIRVKACGICGTDMTSVKSAAADWEAIGHEVAGIIVSKGAHVSHLEVGASVTLETSTFCRMCDWCRNGRYDLCNKGPSFWGRNFSMGFAEYIVAPKEVVVPFEGISFAVASLVEPLGVAMDLTETIDIRMGDDVLVLGLGPIGLMALRLAKLRGARKIYAAARSHSVKRIETALAFGADEIIYTDKTPLETFTFERGGVDKVLVSAPPSTIPSAIKAARTGGVIGYIGIEYGEGATISFDANEFHFKKLQLRASHATPALFFPKCIELLKSGAIDGDALISHTFSLDEFPGAMKQLHEDRGSAIKMVLVNE